MPETLQKLADLFTKFPGIGPRQARRFVHFLLSRNKSFTDDLIVAMKELHRDVKQCKSCFRHFPHQDQYEDCSICRDPNIDESKLIIVEKDTDVDAVRKVDGFSGRFFVLGGLVPLIDSTASYVRLNELGQKLAEHSKELDEVILALSASPEGDHTIDIIRERFSPILDTESIALSILGRGLSTGTELEYSDAETLKSALANRR